MKTKNNQKRIFVGGATGFIAGHLIKRLKQEGHWVRGVDIEPEKYGKCEADELIIADLRDENVVKAALKDIDEVYALNCLMGGANFVFSGTNDHDIFYSSAMMNLHMAKNASEMGIKKLFYSSSACFIKNTPVETKTGLKMIQDLKIGDLVLTHDGTYKKVLKTTNNLYKGNIAKIKIRGVPEITCTEDHRFLTKDNEWIRAKDLKNKLITFPKPKFNYSKEEQYWTNNIPTINKFINEFLLLKNKDVNYKDYMKKYELKYYQLYNIVSYFKKNGSFYKKLKEPVMFEKVKFDYELGELAGIYLAEGWIEQYKNSTKKVTFAFGEEQELINRTIELINKKFGIKKERCRVHSMKGQKGYKLQIVSNELARFFESNCYDGIGKYCYNKQLSELFYQSNKDFHKGILKGFWEGDGSDQSTKFNTSFLFSSTSQTLIHQIRNILFSFNINNSFNNRMKSGQKDFILGREVTLSNCYTVKTNGQEANYFLSELLLNEMPLEPNRKRPKGFDFDKNAFYKKVDDIVLESYEGEVFNLEVEKNHSYAVYGIATHNCIYPEISQLDPNNPNCEEKTAWTGRPDSIYGIEKLMAEELYTSFRKNKGLNVKIARFHNIFGPYGTWKGGKEKVPAAICRKVAEAKDGSYIEIYGDGNQTRSFLYIDECLDGIWKLMEHPTFNGPVNIGSDFMLSVTDLAKMIIDISGKKLEIKNIEGPQGVRGRNSHNTLCKKELNWEPTQPLRVGMEKLYAWVDEQVKLSKSSKE